MTSHRNRLPGNARAIVLSFAAALLSSKAWVPAEVDFNRDVRPILADNCFECHGPDEGSREADLRLDVPEEAIGWVIEPGKSKESSLIERLLSDDPDDVMPPPHSKRRPTKKQIQILSDWIDQGAEYESHWAFVTPKRPAIPKVGNPKRERGTGTGNDAVSSDRSLAYASGFQDWPRNPIDNFVASHLESESLTPRPDAEPRVLARRLSLALTGLPILPEQANEFAEAYKKDSEQAVSSLVDSLLATEAYGEHRAWFWLDAARYADTNGYQADGHRVMWPWRDWLIRNLNANLPFDQLTEQMLAGDLLIPQEQQDWQSADWLADDRSSELLVATGFLRNHRYDTGSGTIPAESKFENAADREIDTRIAQFEMAARMQMSVPELADFSGEPQHILDLYGEDVTEPGTYAYNALMARRLAERGVRFVQLFQGGWGQHSNLPKQIEQYSAYSDRANAALIQDLKQRGMLEDTLVIWGGEFGRTVFCQGKLTKTNFGREHHHLGFTMWMAGARVKAGFSYGQTDEWSFHTVENPVPVHDLNATVLHLMGINHKHLTYRFQGRDFRLTDLAGNVVRGVLV